MPRPTQIEGLFDFDAPAPGAVIAGAETDLLLSAQSPEPSKAPLDQNIREIIQL